MAFQERYRSGDTPWEINRADYNLINAVQDIPISPCRTLDIGCGTGNNALWLSQQGFKSVGIDSSNLAIDRAREKARNSGADCSFHVLDFIENSIPDAPFDFVFDRGCFHLFRKHNSRKQFAAKVAQILNKDGHWLTLTGNVDETREGPGPPRLSALEIISAVEPYFEILSLVANHFDSDQEVPAKNWVCLMKKRNK
ncbi:MAG: class I SAM-dependent methyltransferase [Desulfobulbus sp.]|nr:MAG: class I SAM-dependent methyltransferase [Desulfobulbus sp.]